MADIKIFGNILSYATPSDSGDLVPKWYVDALADTSNRSTMTVLTGSVITPTYSGQVFYKNATANVTLATNVSNVNVTSDECFEYFLIIYSNSKTVTFPSGWLWKNGVVPSTTNKGTYIIHIFTTDGKAKWRAELINSHIDSYDLVFTVNVTNNNKEVYSSNYGTIQNISPYNIDWGDGTTETNYTETYINHTYSSAGTYQIKIKTTNGELPLFAFSELESQLISIDTANVTWTGVDSSSSGIFINCTSLLSIPGTLFANNTNITDFSHCFDNCSNLTSVPATLFSSNTSATTFKYCFSGCSRLSSVPSTLFSLNNSAVDFTGCFQHTGLTTVPSLLFSGKTNATTFTNCFSGCTLLTTIPDNLFASQTKAGTTFSSCFSGCTSLSSIPSTLFDSAKNTGRFFDFSRCFYGCSGLTKTGSVPYVYPVWEFDTSFTNYVGNEFRGKSYTNCTAALQEYIPSPYGGTIDDLQTSHIYTKGDRAFRQLFNSSQLYYYLKVYTFVSDTDIQGSSLNNSSFDDTTLFVEGYDVPSSGINATAVFKGYGAVGSMTLTYEDLNTGEITGGPATWTTGTFNSQSASGTIQNTNAMPFMASTWVLSGGTLTVTLGIMASQYTSTYGFKQGDQIVFTNFVESTSGSTKIATSNTAALVVS